MHGMKRYQRFWHLWLFFKINQILIFLQIFKNAGTIAVHPRWFRHSCTFLAAYYALIMHVLFKNHFVWAFISCRLGAFVTTASDIFPFLCTYSSHIHLANYRSLTGNAAKRTCVPQLSWVDSPVLWCIYIKSVGWKLTVSRRSQHRRLADLRLLFVVTSLWNSLCATMDFNVAFLCLFLLKHLQFTKSQALLGEPCKTRYGVDYDVLMTLRRMNVKDQDSTKGRCMDFLLGESY